VQVLVVGGLTYDNEHLVNADPQHRTVGSRSVCRCGRSIRLPRSLGSSAI
jgi:hypothetical protein